MREIISECGETILEVMTITIFINGISTIVKTLLEFTLN